MNNDTVPYFEYPENPLHPDKPIIERDNVEVILFDPKTRQVLCLDWEKFGWKTFIIGGIDADTVQGAAQREVREETGYTDITFVSEIGKTRSGYFATHKNENRIANTTVLLYVLNSDVKDDIDPAEFEKHVPVWISLSEVADYLNDPSEEYLWKKAFREIENL